MTTYTNVEKAWTAMLDDIRHAKKTIYLEQYLIAGMEEGEIGNTLVSLLQKKLREGLEVRVLVDAFGSHDLILSNDWDSLKRAGAVVNIFGLVPKWRFKLQPPFLNRNHRKLLVVDNRIVHVGGVVFSESVRGWNDFNVRLEESADQFLKSFEIMWGHAKDEQNNQIFHCPNFSIANMIPHRDAYYKSLLTRIKKSKNRVWVISPYFSPDFRMRLALYRAARRGVDVRLILPERTDNVFADMATSSFISTLLRKRVKVCIEKGAINHAKVVIIDDLVTFGSMNFDRLSFFYNYELNVETSVVPVAPALIDAATVFVDRAVMISKKEWHTASWLEKLRRKIGFFLRPFV